MGADEEGVTVLVVETTGSETASLAELLSPDCLVRRTTSLASARAAALCPPAPRLILLALNDATSKEDLSTLAALAEDPKTASLPIILLTPPAATDLAEQGLARGAVDFISFPLRLPLLLARMRLHLAMGDRDQALAMEVRVRTRELMTAQTALRAAMNNLRVSEITAGVYWLQVPEADLYVLCGTPAEVVKHMMRRGVIATIRDGDGVRETGPNAILLSDLMVQNGAFANLAEFPVLQMLYRQGMLLPGHPNNTGARPLLIGSAEQVRSQLGYIHRGNYGLLSVEELTAAGVSPEDADIMMRVKRFFAFGAIRSPESFIDSVVVGDTGPVPVKNGVTVARIGLNRFQFAYRGKTVVVDLNLPPGVSYQAPYTLHYHHASREYFAVLHTGEGDGWDINRPSMSSVLMFQGRIYLVDAPPNVLYTLETLGIDISEVEGVFQTHAHDDHFAGLTSLILSDHRIKYFATPMVCASVAKKLAALMNETDGVLDRFFAVTPLEPDAWNDCDGMQVRPLYSPHPVETNLLLFRIWDGAGIKSYAHWADLCSREILTRMAGAGEDAVPEEFIARIEADYSTPADVKKLDIGGGLIHGLAKDFAHDLSPRIFLAHLDRALTNDEKEIGSAAPFGALDILVPSNRDYCRRHAFMALDAVFPNLAPERFGALLNVPILSVNPGTIIRKSRVSCDYVDMVLTGGVEYVHAETGVCYRLANGAFIGEFALFDDVKSSLHPEGTWRAVSHVRLLRVPLVLMQAFLRENGLVEWLRGAMARVNFLRETWLFGEKLTFAVQNRIARALVPVTLEAGKVIRPDPLPTLYLVLSGRMTLNDRVDLGPGDFFGQEAFLNQGEVAWSCRGDEASALYVLQEFPLATVPIIYWKMLEMTGRRCRKHSGEPATKR